MAAKLKKGDRVVVLAGKDKGREGEISQVLPKQGKAVINGLKHRHPAPATDPDRSGRPPAQGNADRPFEPRAA